MTSGRKLHTVFSTSNLYLPWHQNVDATSAAVFKFVFVLYLGWGATVCN